MALVMNTNKSSLKASEALSAATRRLQYTYNQINKKSSSKISDDAAGLGMSDLGGTRKTFRKNQKGVRTIVGSMMLSAFSGGGVAGGR